MIDWSSKTTTERIEKVLIKLEDLKVKEKEKIVLISFERLKAELSKDEWKVIETIKQIDPIKFGFRGKYLGGEKVPDNLVAINGQKYCFRKKEYLIGIQYLIKPVNEAYQRMLLAIKKDLGRGLLVDSGYRSPAYQCLVFLYHLKVKQFDFNSTIRLVAMPGYSEHGCVTKPGLDFISEKGMPTTKHPLNFSRQPEYRWLRKNAARFGFSESYPKNNLSGISFEPWHWSYLLEPRRK